MTDNANRCIFCNEIIPEGRQICPACEAEADRKDKSDRIAYFRGLHITETQAADNWRTCAEKSGSTLAMVKMTEHQRQANWVREILLMLEKEGG